MRDTKTVASAESVPGLSLRLMPFGEVSRLLDDGDQPGMAWHRQYPSSDTFAAALMMQSGNAIWGLHQILLDQVAIGDVGFHGPPDEEDRVEIGYHVVPELRGRGIATAAVRRLLDIAFTGGAVTVMASTDRANVASQRVLIHCGFALDRSSTARRSSDLLRRSRGPSPVGPAGLLASVGPVETTSRELVSTGSTDVPASPSRPPTPYEAEQDRLNWRATRGR